MPPMSLRANARRKLTDEDYLALREEGAAHEILGGRSFAVPPLTKKDLYVLERLTPRLRAFVDASGASQGGRILTAPFHVKLTRHDVLQPDLFFISAARTDLLNGEVLEGAPDLVIEILSDIESARQKDLLLKHRLYERFGVLEYWIIEPPTRTVWVDRLLGGVLRRGGQKTLRAGDALSTPLLPGLEIALSEIFPPGRFWGTT